MTDETQGLARSVHTRLVRHAHAQGLDPNLVLQRYGLERFLYRLSKSEHAERFVLKGALLLLAWLGETLRPTRDADFLGFGDLSPLELRETITEILAVPVPDDGLAFDPDSVEISDIRGDDDYGGRRVRAWTALGAAQIRLQLDIGIGDATEPPPAWLEYPCLLDFPAPRIRAYRPETVVAEKAHALVVLGAVNSRMRDFFDLHILADGGKAREWRAFLTRTGIDGPESLADVTPLLKEFLTPVLRALQSEGDPPGATWPPGGPWT